MKTQLKRKRSKLMNVVSQKKKKKPLYFQNVYLTSYFWKHRFSKQKTHNTVEIIETW